MSSLIVTIIQPNIAWENKEANLQMLSKKIESIQEKTEVIILPEMFSTGFSMNAKLLAEKMDGETMQWMRSISKVKKAIVTGSIIIQEEEKYFNRLVWMLPDGTYGFYDKRHLFAFANEHQHYNRGNRRLIASVNGWKINLQICYDLRFPVWSRQASGSSKSAEEINLEYDLLVFVANWPQKRNKVWKVLLQARAIENQCYVVGVNRVGNDSNEIYYSGGSMIIDPLGEILYQKENEEDVFTYALEKQKLTEVREKFPFWKDADNFNL